ncbi:MAG: hypothetical protein H0Z39_10865 [Peptococcaceae bacterium]|nr:hypothetical protein [Peptococcaceae bacterium]
MTAAEIGRKLNVSKVAVAKGLKCFDSAAYRMEQERRKRENVERRREGDRNRKQTPRVREKDRERKRRDRFLRMPYARAVAKLVRDDEVQAVIRRAMRHMRVSYQRRMLANLLPAMPEIPHPVPHEAKDPIHTTPSEAAGRATFEMKVCSRTLVGVPGPAILRIKDALEQYDLDKALRLAEDAIRNAGLVSPETTVEQVLSQTTTTIDPHNLPDYWNRIIQAAREWAPAAEPVTPPASVLVRRWYAQARAAERRSQWMWGSTGTGKRGKGGGIQNTAMRQKWEAVR